MSCQGPQSVLWGVQAFCLDLPEERNAPLISWPGIRGCPGPLLTIQPAPLICSKRLSATKPPLLVTLHLQHLTCVGISVPALLDTEAKNQKADAPSCNDEPSALDPLPPSTVKTKNFIWGSTQQSLLSSIQTALIDGSHAKELHQSVGPSQPDFQRLGNLCPCPGDLLFASYLQTQLPKSQPDPHNVQRWRKPSDYKKKNYWPAHI